MTKNESQLRMDKAQARRDFMVLLGIVLLTVAVMVIMTIPAIAAPRGVVWSHGGDNLAGFKIYEHLGTSAEVVMLVDGQERRADLEVPDDDKCHTYMMTAYNGDAETGPESGYSNPLAICPEKVLPEVETAPSTVIRFQISGTAEMQVQ